MEIDIEARIDELAKRLLDAFGDRLILVGIQGSRARGEAKETSDIDAVVLIEGLATRDVECYRAIVATLPHAELACGFIGSPAVLSSWPRHDAFNLVNDTKVVYGSFDFMNTEFSREDALLSAKVGASEVYHAFCHTIAFEPESLAAVVDACAKNAFFIMRALVFAETGEYPRSRARLAEVIDSEQRRLLDLHDHLEDLEADEAANLLLAWSEQIIDS